jgi:hypothetical protein
LTRAATIHVSHALQVRAASPDAEIWQNQYGGLWSTAANWLDTITGSTATSPPTSLNPVTITGGINNNFTDIVGSGAAAQLSINNDVLLYGTAIVSGAVTLGGSADFDLDGGGLVAAGLNVGDSASMVVGAGSWAVIAGGGTLAAGFLTIVGGSTVGLGTLVANNINTGYSLETSTIAVDDGSSLEVGIAGGVSLGAITIDAGQSAAISGKLYGNIVANGTVAVQAGGALAIDVGDPYGTARNIGGSGMLLISENSLLTLGIADTAAIRFGGPAGTLALDVLPSGTISGFTSGDAIELIGGATVMATSLSYTQTSNSVATLTLTKAGSVVGTLTLAGNYAGSMFHLGFDTQGDGIITLQTPGIAPVQPSLIVGTGGTDVLVATANNQTLTGFGGNDTLGAATFAGIDFKDTSTNLNGSTITSFGATELIDLTDMNPNTVTVSYAPGTPTATLTVTDGTHTATIALSLSAPLPPGFFTSASDGVGGTIVRYNAANIDVDTFAATPGGLYGTAANWQDITTGTIAALAPSYGNAVTIAGGATYTNITGSGFAASLAMSGDVLLWGSLVAGSKLAGVTGAMTQTGTLALDGAAHLVLAGTASIGGLVDIGGASTLTAAAVNFSSNGASVLAVAGSSVQFATLLPSGGSTYDTSAIVVDATSTIEIGTGGSLAAGALTIDRGVTANLSGTISGNVVVNGTLIAIGTLAVVPLGPAAPSVTGSGTLELTYGDTLSLAGPDSTAILFSQTSSGSYASTTETLVLGTSMPTAVITGFVKGDVITVGLIVTNLTWNGASLVLLNGGTTVGTLLLSGIHAANQFQVQLAPNGLSSIITYAATPATSSGNSVSGNADLYAWNNVNGGVWSVAADWTDTTAGGAPTAAPGASNAVTINDNPGGSTSQIIYGPAAAASLTISAAANTILIGNIAVTGLFSVAEFGTTSAGVALVGGTNLSAGSLNVTSLLRLSGASLLTVLGLSTGTFISGALSVGGGSAVRISGGTSVISGMVAVDGSSSVEFGTAGTATSGTLAIDYLQTLTLQGVGTIAANLVLNGSLVVYSGTIEGFGGTVGSISGNGTITLGALGASGSLILNASDTDPINFVGYSTNGVGYAFESLELKGPLRTGTISGFVAGDTIIVDRNVTGASFVQTTASLGKLTLTNGATIVGTLTFAGNYAASLFQVDMAPATGVTTISLQTVPTATGTASASTGSHAYKWTGASGGNWATAANWQDLTIGTPPTLVPGSGNAVTISGSVSTGQYTTIGGNGATADLAVTGNVLLTGQVTVAGAVHVSSGTGPATALTLAAGARLTAGASAEIFGRLEVGGGSSVTLPGYALLFGGSLLALGGSIVQAGGLIGDSSGDVIAIDANSVVKIGTSAGTAAGALTIASGAPAEFAGLIYGSVVDNGALWVAGGGTLFIDMNATAENDPYASNPTISGTGLLVLTAGSTLGLGVVDSAAILFDGPNATLVLAAMPTAAISGFAAGDQIQVDQTVTGMTYRQTSSSLATLTLTNGASTVGTLNMAGNFSSGGSAFHLDTAPNGATAVITLQSLLIAPAQMTLIQGTVGADVLTASGNGQTITGLGGGDILSGGAFTGIDFKDYSFYLSGSAIQAFAPSDVIDFLDVSAASASVTYSAGTLSVTDGTHAAVLSLTFGVAPPSGSFHIASDGAAGTKLTWS